MNVSMRAKTQGDAFVEAITYYQKRTKKVEDELDKLQKIVNRFIDSISDDEEID